MKKFLWLLILAVVFWVPVGLVAWASYRWQWDMTASVLAGFITGMVMMCVAKEAANVFVGEWEYL